MILDQSLLQLSKHLGQATCESVEPTQSDKHETHPSSIGGLAAPQPPNQDHEMHPSAGVNLYFGALELYSKQHSSSRRQLSTSCIPPDQKKWNAPFDRIRAAACVAASPNSTRQYPVS